jgi:hypothetical protein
VAARYGAAVRVCAVDGGGGAGLVDDPGHARSAYGITEDALVLVRPDNYVGLIARATGPSRATWTAPSMCRYGLRPTPL